MLVIKAKSTEIEATLKQPIEIIKDIKEIMKSNWGEIKQDLKRK